MYGKSMAHIERIVQTYPIEGADNLEMAQVLDYHVAVKKGEFKASDKALYIEIDSIVPDGLPVELKPQMDELYKQLFDKSLDKESIKNQINELAKNNSIPQFEFLRSRGFKIKQVFFGKLKIYSQGILFPLSVFPQLGNDPKIGFDATDLLNIKQIIEDVDEAGVGTESNAVGRFLEGNIVGKVIDKKLMRYKMYREFKKSLRQPKGI